MQTRIMQSFSNEQLSTMKETVARNLQTINPANDPELYSDLQTVLQRIEAEQKKRESNA